MGISRVVRFVFANDGRVSITLLPETVILTRLFGKLLGKLLLVKEVQFVAMIS